jgi:hypothetical protein
MLWLYLFLSIRCIINQTYPTCLLFTRYIFNDFILVFISICHCLIEMLPFVLSSNRDIKLFTFFQWYLVDQLYSLVSLNMLKILLIWFKIYLILFLQEILVLFGVSLWWLLSLRKLPSIYNPWASLYGCSCSSNVIKLALNSNRILQGLNICFT